MSNQLSLTPDQTISEKDAGDETAKRYRYQHTWAAIVCCELLDETLNVKEVFCEQHEDVLIKYTDNTFTGQQIKTRESNQPLWKANEEQVIGTFRRFFELEKEFTGAFRSYALLTNHPLHQSKTATSLDYILDQVKNTEVHQCLPQSVIKWIERILKDSEINVDVAIAALKKTVVRVDLPRLPDARIRLVQTLCTSWPTATECSFESIQSAALRLIDECGRASALDHEQLLPPYLQVIKDSDSSIERRIDGKRFRVERVRSLLEEGMLHAAPLVGSQDSVGDWSNLQDQSLMLKKLSAGGLSIVSLNSAKDLRDKADYLGIAWMHKKGTNGSQRIEHIRSLVLSDAARSFEMTKNEDSKFGSQMRETLRDRFLRRRSEDAQLYDYTDDHLEGVAYALTAECKIVWSLDRPWEFE